MARATFYPADHFARDRAAPYTFLPFRFIDLDSRKMVVNEVGEYLLLSPELFSRFLGRTLPASDPTYQGLKSKHFLTDSDTDVPVRLLATKYRTKRGFLAGFTRLHIFVVTLRCDHTCQYCQVSRVTTDKARFDMSRDAAAKALDLTLRAPAKDIKIEFQGGEPLLNFDLISWVVEEAERKGSLLGKNIEFVITSNLAYLTDDILAFLKAHNVLLSTSLDGPAFIHNANRPRPGNNSHALTLAGIDRAREVLGAEKVAALMTTSRLSLGHPVDIINEYVKEGFHDISLRPISPYGFAVRTHSKTGYETEDFLEFYRRGLDHIIDLNRQGTPFLETYAQLLLTKILTPYPTGYVDLQSPAGAGIGVAVYNYDGDVYVSDEARMLAEMGDRSFRLGSVHDSYDQLFGGELLRSLVAMSCVESLPGCSDCALQTYCGCDPVENYATQGSVFGHRPTSAFCRRNMEIIKHLIRQYEDGDDFVRHLFWSWVQNCHMDDLLPSIQG